MPVFRRLIPGVFRADRYGIPEHIYLTKAIGIEVPEMNFSHLRSSVAISWLDPVNQTLTGPKLVPEGCLQTVTLTEDAEDDPLIPQETHAYMLKLAQAEKAAAKAEPTCRPAGKSMPSRFFS